MDLARIQTVTGSQNFHLWIVNRFTRNSNPNTSDLKPLTVALEGHGVPVSKFTILESYMRDQTF